MDLLGNLANLKVDTVLSAVDKYVPGASSKVKNLADKAKAYVNNVTELEFKVLEATNHEPWGPHGTVMQEITQASFQSENFFQIMGVLDQRLQESPENWRLVYKSLLLLEYMCKHGPMSVVEALASYSRQSHLEKLADRFQYKDPAGRDQGINVRQRAKALADLVQDRERLAGERDKAAKNKSKYTGVSSGSTTRYGGFSGGTSSSSSSYNTGGGYGSSGSSSSYAAGGFSGGDSHFSGGSSSSKFGSSGAGAADGADGGGLADPVEATRRRIEKLKATGAIGDGGTATAGGGGSEGGLGALDGPGLGGDDGAGGRKPKKLSDIKVNPAISAAFAGGLGGLAPPPGAGGSRAPAAAAGAVGGGGGGGVSSGIDLLGDLDETPAPAARPGGGGGGGGGGLDEWDGFASAAAAPGPSGRADAGAGDDWGAFDSAPAAAAGAGGSKKAPLDINALLGPIPTTSPVAGPGVKAPLPLDDFCSMPAAAAPPAAAAAPRPPVPAAADDFGSFSAAPPAAAGHGGGGFGGASDPFAASGSVHMLPQAAKHHPDNGAPKLGPETAKAKDPFADLAFL